MPTVELRKAGYQIIPDILSARDCDDLIAHLSRIARTRAGARHLMSVPPVVGLAALPPLTEAASGALSGEAAAFRATLFEKTRDANWHIFWHQDTALPLEMRFDAPGWGPWSVKAGIHYAHAPAWALEQVVALRVHLDDSGPENGPLRVLPGSHRLGLLSDEAVRQLSVEMAAADCIVPRGGVLAMYPLLVHSSRKAATAALRRVLHIEYARSRVLGDHIQLAVA